MTTNQHVRTLEMRYLIPEDKLRAVVYHNQAWTHATVYGPAEVATALQERHTGCQITRHGLSSLPSTPDRSKCSKTNAVHYGLSHGKLILVAE